MKFESTGFDGLYLIRPEPYADERGWFFRTYCEREFASIGFTGHFVQMNLSHNKKKGTLRGMHAQIKPHQEAKLIRCIKGRIWDVVVDLRVGSPTFLQYFAVELSEYDFLSLWVPEGFAHGFLTLEDATELIYHHTHFYTPGEEFCVRYDDPAVGIKWPDVVETVSEKDRSYAFIQQDFKGI